jgi:Ca2+-binding EF-hand superfamily protein
MIDTDNSGQITFEELKVGLKKVGANLKESEIYDLMQAVSIFIRTCCYKNRKKQVVLVR